MKIKILASAKQDLADGFLFYEKQSEGIGVYFMDSLFSDIDSLVINAGIHAVHYKKYHCLLSKRFPFAVYYRVNKQTVFVYAVLDSRKSPAWTRKRLM